MKFHVGMSVITSIFLRTRYGFVWELGGNVVYRPTPSSKNSYFQNEAKCKIFFVKMSYICMRKKNSVAFSLGLKERLRAIWRWPIDSKC